MELYSRDEIAQQKEIRVRAKRAMATAVIAAVVICVALCIFVTPLNEKAFRIIGIAAASLAGCVVIYLSSFVLPYMRPKPSEKTTLGKVGRVLWNIVHQLHMYIIWILLAGIIVSFLFNRVTDVPAKKKIVIFADVYSIEEEQLETVLNEDLPEGIKMTQVHPFSYSAFGMSGITEADIYIIKESNIKEYKEIIAPLYESWPKKDIDVIYDIDGEAYGIRVYCPTEGKKGMAADYIGYTAEGEPMEDYYLFFGKGGVHKGLGGEAAYIVEKLMEINGGIR